MEMTGERIIPAPRADVWAALNDPEVLQSCISGCTEFEKTADDAFAATVKQKVGPVSATFKGAVTLTDIVPEERYTITGEGKGGAAGFAKGGATVTLEDAAAPEGSTGPATKLSYAANAKVGGKLAQLGSRLIDGFARKMADDFFDKFSAKVAGEPPAASAEPSPAPTPPPAEAGSGAAAEAGAPEAAAEPAASTPAEEPKKEGWLKRIFG
ncbi:MAG: carbon monoxide dehydrogenase subunit G [Pseudomonadota bacterium]